MSIILAVATLVACAVLNRVRGDDRWMRNGFSEEGAKRLPGRALWYVSPLLGAVAWFWVPWPAACAFGAGYLFWAVFPWGHILAAVAGFTPPRPPSRLEAALLSQGSVAFAAFARMMFIAPGVLAVGVLVEAPTFLIAAPIFAIFATIAYAFRLGSTDAAGWRDAELITGALVGALILAAGAASP